MQSKNSKTKGTKRNTADNRRTGEVLRRQVHHKQQQREQHNKTAKYR